MTPELKMLVACALLALLQSVPSLVAVLLRGGFRVALGNRSDVPALPEWANRAERAQRNYLVNLVPFSALVLVCHQSGLANAESASGASLFFWSRLAYAAIYLAGIPYLRTVAFVASLSGMFDIVRVVLAGWSMGEV